MTENLPPDQPQPSRGDPLDPSAAETARMSAGDPLGAGPERPAGDQPPPAGDPPPPPAGDPPPPPASGPAQRRLTRSREDRLLFGVAGGIGAHLGVDAALVRLAFVLLAFAGGAGLVAYVAAILLVPGAPADGSTAPAGAAPERRSLLAVAAVVLVVLVAGPVLLPFAVLGLAGIATAWLVTGRRPAREPGPLLRSALVGVGILALLGVLFAGAFWTAGLGGEVVVASLVIAAGVALLVGAVARPARWLILPALAIAIPAGFVAAAGIELDGGTGERTYRPGSAAQVEQRYELGAGQLVVDLRGADLPAGDLPLELQVGMGEAVLIVPEDVCVATDARVGMGLVELFDRDNGGVDVDVADSAAAPTGTARVVLDADLGLGHLDVRHSDVESWDPDDRRFEQRFEDDDDPAGNKACAGATS